MVSIAPDFAIFKRYSKPGEKWYGVFTCRDHMVEQRNVPTLDEIITETKVTEDAFADYERAHRSSETVKSRDHPV